MVNAVQELDVRTIPPPERHRRVFETFDGLPDGSSFVLVADHEPRPLFYQFRAERAGEFTWMPLEKGPALWKVRLTRFVHRNEERSLQRFFERDHDEIDSVLGYVRDDLRRAIQAPERPTGALTALFEEFDLRLDRHIRWEEEVLFPAVERVSRGLADGPGRVMRLEHEEIRGFKAAAREMLSRRPATRESLDAASRALESMVGVLLQHNEKEEDIYYPLAASALSPSEAAGVLDRVRAIR